MKCNLKNRNSLIADYISGELTEADQRAFEEHYFECQDCFQYLQKTADAVTLVERDGHNAFTRQSYRFKSFAKGLDTSIAGLFKLPWRWPKLVSIASALILIFGLPLIYQQFQKGTSIPQIVASNFEESPAFESLMNQTYQSGLLVSEVHPNNEQSFDDDIKFRWHITKAYAEAVGQIELRIMDNKEQELYSYKTTDNQLDFHEVLMPGVYYWALLSEKEMIYLGRFYVGKN